MKVNYSNYLHSNIGQIIPGDLFNNLDDISALTTNLTPGISVMTSDYDFVDVVSAVSLDNVDSYSITCKSGFILFVPGSYKWHVNEEKISTVSTITL